MEQLIRRSYDTTIVQLPFQKLGRFNKQKIIQLMKTTLILVEEEAQW